MRTDHQERAKKIKKNQPRPSRTKGEEPQDCRNKKEEKKKRRGSKSGVSRPTRSLVDLKPSRKGPTFFEDTRRSARVKLAKNSHLVHPTRLVSEKKPKS